MFLKNNDINFCGLTYCFSTTCLFNSRYRDNFVIIFTKVSRRFSDVTSRQMLNRPLPKLMKVEKALGGKRKTLSIF